MPAPLVPLVSVFLDHAVKRETPVFPENKEERVTKVRVVLLVNRATLVLPVPMVSKVHLALASVVHEVLLVMKVKRTKVLSFLIN